MRTKMKLPNNIWRVIQTKVNNMIYNYGRSGDDNLLLFIDDERYPVPFGSMYISRTMVEVKELMKTEKFLPAFISFDHDLGEYQPSGMDIAKWLIDQELENNYVFPPEFTHYVHSQNPVGRDNINGLFKSFWKFKNR